jgi:hypothetical protein
LRAVAHCGRLRIESCVTASARTTSFTMLSYRYCGMRSFGLRRGPARAWIFTIVRNTAFKSRRSADREVAVDNAALFSMLDDEEIAESRSRKLIMPICETVLRR